MMTRLFMLSRNKEDNKKWIQCALYEAFLVTKVHLQALRRHRAATPLQRGGKFWSRTELLRCRQQEPPLLLPSSFGTVLKICATLRDWGVFVCGLTVPIMFVWLELMRRIIDVPPHICAAFYLLFVKMIIVVAVTYIPSYFVSKCIAERRKGSPLLMLLSCVVATALAVLILRPGSFGVIRLSTLPRFYGYFSLIMIAPCSAIRAFSQVTSPIVITVVFGILYS
jgi:hypothetical protein